MKKYARVGLVIVLVLGVGAFFYIRSQTSEKPSLELQTRKVERGALIAKVTATGTLSALVTVQVGSQVSGRIQKIFVDYNSEVQKEDVLAILEPQLFEAEVDRTRANLQAAEAQLEKARAEAANASRQLARAEELLSAKLMGQSEYETFQTAALSAQAQMKVAQGSLAQVRAAYEQARLNKSYATIHSPIKGVVIARNIDVGQTVAASLQAPVLFTIAEDLKKMQVDTFVAEADVGKIQPGMKATFRVDAYPNETFEGKVRQVRNSPTVQQNVVTYNAVIDVENAALKLRPGMTANVSVVYAKKEAVLKIPQSALRFRPPVEWKKKSAPVHPSTTVERTVWLLKQGEPVAVQIQTGLSDGTFVEVEQGELKLGDALITQAEENSKEQQNPFKR